MHAGIDRQIANIVDAIADGVATTSMKSKLLDLEREKENLARELQAMAAPESIVEFHPAAVTVYRRQVSEPQDALQSDECERHEATRIIRTARRCCPQFLRLTRALRPTAAASSSQATRRA
ncbi:hypothetical protein [Mesorhizobium sp. M0643]|uniref:hypothetical protein n=1 Tax=Mesorhizobium sp. M0643 TaxID=2956978 RepID=UPI003334E884